MSDVQIDTRWLPTKCLKETGFILVYDFVWVTRTVGAHVNSAEQSEQNGFICLVLKLGQDDQGRGETRVPVGRKNKATLELQNRQAFSFLLQMDLSNLVSVSV